MTIAIIKKALLDHVDTLPLSPGLDVVKPGKPYKPVIGRPYLEVVFAPNETNTPFVGNDDPKQLQGFLQITVVSPRLETPAFDPWEVASAIISHYTKGTVLRGEDGVNVKMIREPWASVPLPDEGWSRVPVSIPYSCIA